MNGGQKYVHNFTNDIIYGKSLLDLSDKKVTEEKRTLSLIIELNKTEKIKDLVKHPELYPWEVDDYKDLIE
tara:strand:- start:384 stop:596 length:213 start_codon:yes stop_codon:yes gene_type:complete